MTNHLDVYSGYREYLAPFVYGKISQHHIEDTIKVLHEEATTIYGHIEKNEEALAKTKQLEKQHTQRNNKLLKLNEKIKSVSKELNLDMQATTSEIAQKMIPMITPVTSSVEIALAKRQNLKMYREKKSLISTLNYIKGFDHSSSDFAKLDFLYPIYRYLGGQLTPPLKNVLAHLACLGSGSVQEIGAACGQLIDREKEKYVIDGETIDEKGHKKDEDKYLRSILQKLKDKGLIRQDQKVYKINTQVWPYYDIFLKEYC